MPDYAPSQESTEEIVIADYDPGWPAAFEAEKDRIVGALGAVMDGVVGIEHVGSTAVPGLAAKPIIDMMIGVQAVVVGEGCIEPMNGLGYQCMGEYGIAGRLYFRRGTPRSHHVHLVEHGGDFWERHIMFRDLLRARPDLMEEYAHLKLDLARRHRGDRPAYTDAKSPFIESVLAQASTGS